MPQVVQDLSSQVSKLKKELARMCSLSSDLITLCQTKMDECAQVQNENLALKEQLTEIGIRKLTTGADNFLTETPVTEPSINAVNGYKSKAPNTVLKRNGQNSS